MIKNKQKITLSIALFFSLHFSSAFADHIEVDQYQPVAETVRKLGKKYGPTHVVVAVDLDDTILSMNQDLGSESWFTWQEGLTKEKSPDAIASSFDQLLELNGKILFLSGTHPVRTDASAIFKALKEEGYPLVVLTSRGTDYRDATFRELKKNGFDFAHSTLNQTSQSAGPYLPYSTNPEEDSSLWPIQIKDLKLGAPREVYFENGVYFTAGQHKGAMLRALLARVRQDVHAVVFVDNLAKHLDRMQAAFSDREVVTYRFTAADNEIKRFNANDKQPVSEAWINLKTTLDAVFK